MSAYTYSTEGPKLHNPPLFTEAEIESGDIKLEDPALFRIASKWVDEL